jgi:site-specific DNA-methyltransferase (adenine-specific)
MKFLSTCDSERFDLVIVDPPYFEVKGDFDFIWPSFDAYLNAVEEWAGECARVLKKNGSLFWWGHAKKIAYSQVILDRHLRLVNSIVWEKTECQTKAQDFEHSRSFAPVTERLLFYSGSKMDLTGLESVEKEYVAPRNPFSRELRNARKEKGASIKDVAEYGKFYGNVNHGGAVTNWEKGYNIPSSEQWKTMCEYLPTLRKEYEELRKEYEELRRPFNNVQKLTDVLKYSQESSVTAKHKHPTQKAPKLCRSIIAATMRKGGEAFIPFLGSFVEAIECYNLGMSVVGCELDRKWYDLGMRRFQRETRQIDMFGGNK